jgi:two-component system, OmpR family, sensor histidine kinase BaeS
MTLRTRLFVSGLVVVIPLTLGLLLINERLRLKGMEDTLRRSIDNEISAAALERCESNPEQFTAAFRGGRRGFPPPPPPGERRGGPGRGDRAPYELFVYGADFTPADPRGPAFPDDLRDALGASASAVGSYPTEDGRGVTLGLRVRPAESPCSIVMARMRPRPGTRRDEFASVGLVILSVLGATWLAAGPVIARMRRLGIAVQHSAASRYEEPVPLGGGDEIESLARAFNTAGANIKQHITDVQSKREALQQFVANTTHDIALPLTVLQGHLADLHRALDDRPDDQTRVRASIEEAHYLSSLLRNLGTAAKLDEGLTAIEPRPVDLNVLVERVVSRHRLLARAKSVELDHAVPERVVIVKADVTLLEQAISNIVNNAVQYNSEGGHVAVVLSEQSGNRFVLTVEDDGHGVPASELESLATRRFRGSEARSRRPDGQGLGLSIAAEALARLNLGLQFRARPGGGLIAEISGTL